MYLRVSVSREDVFVILINQGFERFLFPDTAFRAFFICLPLLVIVSFDFSFGE